MNERDADKWLRISAAIASVRKTSGLRANPAELAGIFARELHSCFGSVCCSVFIIDDDGTYNLAEQGFDRAAPQSLYTASMPLMQHLVRTRSTLSDSGGQGSSPDHTCVLQEGAATVVCSPVFVTDAVAGFVYLSSSEESAFNKDSVQLIELVAGEIGALLTLASLNAKIDALEVRDMLTGCFNRNKFDEDIEVDIPCAERYGKPLSLLKIDVDFMKAYNESNGRLRGDYILKKVSETLTYSIRMCDKLYRYSGEEFILILPGIDKERAVFAAGRLQKVLGQLRFEGEAESQPGGKITFSIGVASFPADSGYKDGLLKIVDTALRQAKDNGGDVVISLSDMK